MGQGSIAHGDTDYGVAGVGYAQRRRADPHIAGVIHRALGDARTVLNVGAGTGNYEPIDRTVVGLEPSATMRAQRPAGAAPCVIGTAQALPFDDASFDAVMAVLTVHQWTDLDRGVREMRRVARETVVIVTFDPAAFGRFWLGAYAPEMAAIETERCPSIGRLRELLGGRTEVIEVPVPLACTDGFDEAYYGRPERFLDAEVRASQSVWRKAGPDRERETIAKLAADLQSGAWDRKWGHLRTQPFFAGSLRLVVGSR